MTVEARHDRYMNYGSQGSIRLFSDELDQENLTIGKDSSDNPYLYLRQAVYVSSSIEAISHRNPLRPSLVNHFWERRESS